MTVKEVEERTGLPRANIRYYESEGLIHPARGENGYRDYHNRLLFWRRGGGCGLYRRHPLRPALREHLQEPPESAGRRGAHPVKLCAVCRNSKLKLAPVNQDRALTAEFSVSLA